jgi:hypothetical protein
MKERWVYVEPRGRWQLMRVEREESDMSAKEFAKELFQDVKGSVKEMGPEAKEAAKEIGAELGRLGVQGKAELAQALFSNSNAYVPYGQGQNSKDSQENERGGR